MDRLLSPKLSQRVRATVHLMIQLAIWKVDRKATERVRGKVKGNTQQRKGWPVPKGPRKLTEAAMKRNGLVWGAENHSVGVGHEKSGRNAKNAKIGLTVSAHQGYRISRVQTASQIVIRR